MAEVVAVTDRQQQDAPVAVASVAGVGSFPGGIVVMAAVAVYQQHRRTWEETPSAQPREAAVSVCLQVAPAPKWRPQAPP